MTDFLHKIPFWIRAATAGMTDAGMRAVIVSGKLNKFFISNCVVRLHWKYLARFCIFLNGLVSRSWSIRRSTGKTDKNEHSFRPNLWGECRRAECFRRALLPAPGKTTVITSRSQSQSCGEFSRFCSQSCGQCHNSIIWRFWLSYVDHCREARNSRRLRQSHGHWVRWPPLCRCRCTLYAGASTRFAALCVLATTWDFHGVSTLIWAILWTTAHPWAGGGVDGVADSVEWCTVIKRFSCCSCVVLLLAGH